MSQSKVVKLRICSHCGESITCTAHQIRLHAEKEHGQPKPQKVGNSVHPRSGGKR